MKLKEKRQELVGIWNVIKKEKEKGGRAEMV